MGISQQLGSLTYCCPNCPQNCALYGVPSFCSLLNLWEASCLREQKKKKKKTSQLRPCMNFFFCVAVTFDCIPTVTSIGLVLTLHNQSTTDKKVVVPFSVLWWSRTSIPSVTSTPWWCFHSGMHPCPSLLPSVLLDLTIFNILQTLTTSRNPPPPFHLRLYTRSSWGVLTVAQQCAVYCTSSCLYSCTLQWTTSLVQDIILAQYLLSAVLATHIWNCTIIVRHFTENVTGLFCLLSSLITGCEIVHYQLVRRFVCTQPCQWIRLWRNLQKGFIK